MLSHLSLCKAFKIKLPFLKLFSSMVYILLNTVRKRSAHEVNRLAEGV